MSRGLGAMQRAFLDVYDAALEPRPLPGPAATTGATIPGSGSN